MRVELENKSDIKHIYIYVKRQARFLAPYHITTETGTTRETVLLNWASYCTSRGMYFGRGKQGNRTAVSGSTPEYSRRGTQGSLSLLEDHIWHAFLKTQPNVPFNVNYRSEVPSEFDALHDVYATSLR